MQPIGVLPTKTHTTTKQNTEYNSYKVSVGIMRQGNYKTAQVLSR